MTLLLAIFYALIISGGITAVTVLAVWLTLDTARALRDFTANHRRSQSCQNRAEVRAAAERCAR